MMLDTTRRKFFGLLAGAIAAIVTPAVAMPLVRKLKHWTIHEIGQAYGLEKRICDDLAKRIARELDWTMLYGAPMRAYDDQ